MAEMHRTDYSTSARIVLAHSTKVAKKRNATTFLWLYNKLLACFNCDTICHDPEKRMTVETLLRFIKRCCGNIPDNYQLAMASVALKPCDKLDVKNGEGIRCKPQIDNSWACSELEYSAHVMPGDYILYFKDPKPRRKEDQEIFYPSKPSHKNLFSPFYPMEYVQPFSKREVDYSSIGDDLTAEALRFPHNRDCVVTGTPGTDTQGTGGDPNGTTQTALRWIYPPPINVWDQCPTHCPELISAFKNFKLRGRKTFEVPENLIMMREDIYNLFQSHAFGIDLDASPQGEIYVFHSHEIVRQKITQSSLVVEVRNERSRACLREHFHQCLMSGIIGQDVKDQPESNEANIATMVRKLNGALPKAGEWPQDGEWGTEIGAALKEWLSDNKLEDEFED